MERDERKKVLELLLWMTDRPLKINDILHVLGDPAYTELELRDDLASLGRDLDERQAPFHVVEVAHGFQLASRPALMVTLLPAERLEPTTDASREEATVMSCPAERFEPTLMLCAFCCFLPSVP